MNVSDDSISGYNRYRIVLNKCEILVFLLKYCCFGKCNFNENMLLMLLGNIYY